MRAVNATAAFAVLIAAILIQTGRARAAAEFCPAGIVGGFAPAGGSTYAFVLGAISSRSVSGRLRVETSNGWYSAAFAGVALKPLAKQYTDTGASFSHDDYLSDPVAVRFPKPVTIRYAYVSQAAASGDALLDWDKQGLVSCSPTGMTPLQAGDPKAMTSQPVRLDAASPPAIAASPIDAPFAAGCDDPFEDVRAAQLARVTYPRILNTDTALPTGTSVVSVAVDAHGSLVDAWLWETSGTPILDQAVLDAAKATTYLPARAFCVDVPGYYLLRAVFRH